MTLLDANLKAVAERDFTAGLTEQQRVAFRALHRFALGQSDHAMAVLRGYAGTGKTYLVAHLVSALGGAGLSIAVAAPTNKAVRVLREKIVAAGVAMPEEPTDHREARWHGAGTHSWIEFGSIHSLLGLKLTDRDDGTQECCSARDPSLHEYDFTIIDECSMIGNNLFSRIVAAKRQCRVLFVGDPAQLPPIEPGEAISPAFSKVSFELTLSEVVRQAADNPIIRLSLAIRNAIENEQRVDSVAVAASLPPYDAHPAAAIVPGGPDTCANFALFEIKHGRDARVLAFTNDSVKRYNQALHEALHGRTELPFVPGESVIVHAACDAYVLDDLERPTGIKTPLITSEEAVVRQIHAREHPYWHEIPSAAVTMERDGGAHVLVYIALDQEALNRVISEQFADWRRLKASADAAFNQGNKKLGGKMQGDAKAASTKAWSLRNAFAPLRHAYALTVHKSQGSTFDTAIVDLGDMQRMRSTFAFNRGLYVAATRPRQYLAIVA